jgi:hypothetical protein
MPHRDSPILRVSQLSDRRVTTVKYAPSRGTTASLYRHDCSVRGPESLHRRGLCVSCTTPPVIVKPAKSRRPRRLVSVADALIAGAFDRA